MRVFCWSLKVCCITKGLNGEFGKGRSFIRKTLHTMATERLDVVIFGATGFSGKYIVKEFIKIGHNKYSWGIAGRNHQKLEQLKETLANNTGEDLSGVPIILADCENKKSLDYMAKQTKVLINCCGPYRFYGESIVKACIENGASHVDISGEPEYMEKVQLLYSDAAEQNGVYIVSACGMDSVPPDMGIVFMQNNFNGTLNTVESYMELSSTNKKYGAICNYATWESAVHGFTNQANLVEIRKNLYSKFKRSKLEPRLPVRPNIHRTDLFDNKQCIPFPGSDRSVVTRSQMLLNQLYGQRPVQFSPFLICANWIILTAIMVAIYFLQALTKYPLGRKLLLQFPGVFSFGMMPRNGVPEDVAARTELVIRFRGEGWSADADFGSAPNKTLIAEFSCRNPCYGFTSTSAILSALTIITETAKLPKKGGVYTPAAAFAKTSFIDNLCNHGVSLKILDVKVK